MSARNVKALRLALLVAWLALALIIVGSAQAQDGDTPLTSAAGNPQDMDDVAVRLMPLLVGAALIERTLEFLFNWVERAILDASHYLHGLAARLTGLVQVDLRQAWEQLNKLTSALVNRQVSGETETGGPADADSHDPEQWPLVKLEGQLIAAKIAFEQAQNTMESAMKSPLYVSRKKMAAGSLSILFGVLLAFVSELRLLKPLGVEPADWFSGAFDAFDLILAGVLMGLGTEWVHQVIGLIIQGKGLLGRAGGGGNQPDPELVRELAMAAVQTEFETQFAKLREEMSESLKSIDSSPP